jgi:DNA-binding protein HU-beta
MAGTAKAGAAKTSAPPAKLGKAPVKVAPPTKAKPAAKPKGTAAEKTSAVAAAVSLKQMAAGLAESHNLPKRQVEAMLGEFVQTFAEHLTKGTKIRINGLGIFQVRSRAARLGRNPATGEQIEIKASKKIAFRPAKELKDAV